ncbi:MAG TPA: TlpA disulfide reductase family protein [Pyrinomonadaceae bacterium]|nr:TlpA disulfide reductase family protein [Pyrinomonadaceae bacterium]
MKNIKILFGILTLVVAFATASAAQNVSLPSLDGGNVSLQSQRGKVVVLAIGASWLPLSKQQAIIVNKLSRKYSPENVAIYFVTTDSANAKSKNFADDAAVRAFAARNKMTAPILRDADGAATMKRFKVDQLPSFVLIDKDGNPSEPYAGLDPDAAATDNLASSISQAIDRLL